jgi:hypothetical protein
MIINHGGKSYDTSNGEENFHEGSLADPNAEDRSKLDRWADDGAEPRSPASILKAVATRVATRIVALRGLVRVKEPDKPLAPRRVEAPAKKPDVSPEEAKKAYYRNAWENT